MAINSDILKELLPLLTRHVKDEKDCQAYLRKSLGTDETVSKRVNWNTSFDIFIIDTVRELELLGKTKSGKPAICAFLKEIYDYVGDDEKLRINDLIEKISKHSKLKLIQNPPHLLFDLLLQMDFKQQVRLVKKVMELHRTAAFLVHGEPYCGQQILVTRLFRLKRQWKNIAPIKIDMSFNGIGRSIPHLWRHVASSFNLPKNAELNQIIEKVIERVCEILLNQDVIFIFYTVDYMLPGVLEEWRKEFWETLVERIEPNSRPTPEGTHLLMFLVDNSGTFSPVGQILASSSNLELRDGCIKLWDVEPAKLRQTLGGGLINLRVSSLAFSPDGQTLASGHAEAKIRLWRLNGGKLRQTLKGHGWDVNSLAFSCDGRFLVSGGLDGAIKIWNWRTGEEVRTLKRPPSSEWIGSLVSWFDSSVGAIWSVAVSPDRKTFASAGSQQPIELWDLETGKLLRILTEHSSAVYSVAFSADGKILASGGEDNTIKLWNVLTGELLETLEHLGPVRSVAFSPDGQTLVSGSADTTIKLWQIYDR